MNTDNKKTHVVIVGAGPGGIYTAYELSLCINENFSVTVIESGPDLNDRHCPVVEQKVDKCIHCRKCSIMNGFGGAGAFSDGKYNITNDFGGTLHTVVGKDQSIRLMNYVDAINMNMINVNLPKYSKVSDDIDKLCTSNNLHLLNAEVRHLGTDFNRKVLSKMYNALVNAGVKFEFNSTVYDIKAEGNTYKLTVVKDSNYYTEECDYCVVSTGRSGSKWVENICDSLNIKTTSNTVDIGVRVEIPHKVFSHITDELYEGKIVYKTSKYQDLVRTFCMNPKGSVVVENTNGIITVNGHSYEDKNLQTTNTNFALLVSEKFTEPFKNSNEYGESIAKLSNMLGGGVIVQRFGDLIRGQRSTDSRIEKSFVSPTLKATPGDLSLVLPKRILDDIIEMIYALDKIAPGTASDDTLLYGVEVKFYDMNVDLDHNYNKLFFIGDCSGITHSLSQASAHGVYTARKIISDIRLN